jgi:hypothetical protein
MNRYLIIGGGVSGIITARVLQKRGLPFQGLEASRELGRDLGFIQLKVHNDRAVAMLRDLGVVDEWKRVEDQAKERKKGDWVSAESDYIDEERAFLGAPFYRPSQDSQLILEQLKHEVRSQFLTGKTLERLDTDRKIAFCKDGAEIEFESILWCTDLNSLIKMVSMPLKHSLKKYNNKHDIQGGIHLELELSQPLLAFNNSVVFPFRYKEYKLRAVGFNENTSSADKNAYKMHWFIFLERELADDREEVAKVIRAFKRELNKDFSDLSKTLLKEKIVFQPQVGSYSPIEVEGLELFPNIHYVGPELQLNDTAVDRYPLDLTLENCQRVEKSIQ